MKNKKIQFFTFSVLFYLLIFTFHSCKIRDDFEFKEIENLKDSTSIKGSLATSLIEAKFNLEDLIPEGSNENFWIEVDNNKLIHFRFIENSFTTIKITDFVNKNQIFVGNSVPGASVSVAIDTLELKLKKIINGKFFIADPRIKIILRNSIPVSSTFFKLDSIVFLYQDKTKGSLKTGGIMGQNYDVKYPTIPGQIKTDTLFFNKSIYPTLPQLFSGIPQYLSMGLTVGTNTFTVPAGMTGNETLDIGGDFDIPFDVQFTDFVVSDTFNLDLTTDVYDNFKAFQLKMKFDNGFPLENYLQIYFAPEKADGSAGAVVDSAFTDNTKGWQLKPATTDATGKVTANVSSTLDLTINNTKFEKIRNKKCKKLIIKANLNLKSTTSPSVKIYSNYSLGIKIAAKVDYQVSSGK